MKLTLVIMAVGICTIPEANAQSLDFFSEASTTAPLDNDTDTGQLSSLAAESTNPITSLYYDPTIGYNVTSGSPVSTGRSKASAEFIHNKLESIQLHAAGGATFLYPVGYGFGFPASANAFVGDTLYFKNSGASASTVTTVGFSVQIDGTLSPFTGTDSGLAEASISLEVGLGSLGAFNPVASNVQDYYDNAIVWYGSPNVVDTDMIGTFTFTGSTATVPLLMQLHAQGQYAFADFSDTATFSFSPLPSGVSFTSASSVVPEPATWAMLLLGYAGLCFVGWSRVAKPRLATRAS
jgi:hypothetical protein